MSGLIALIAVAGFAAVGADNATTAFGLLLLVAALIECVGSGREERAPRRSRRRAGRELIAPSHV